MVGFPSVVRNGALASQAQTSPLLSLHSGISLTTPCPDFSHFTVISSLAPAVLNLLPPSATPSPMLSGSPAVLNLGPPSATPSPMLSNSTLSDPFPSLQLSGRVSPIGFGDSMGSALPGDQPYSPALITIVAKSPLVKAGSSGVCPPIGPPSSPSALSERPTSGTQITWRYCGYHSPIRSYKPREIWGPTLVGYFYDSPLHFQIVSTIARKIWARFGISHVAGNVAGFFFFHFSNTPMIEKSLKAGP